nr:hypothetical protein CFP56_53744 [Quercus suber]
MGHDHTCEKVENTRPMLHVGSPEHGERDSTTIIQRYGIARSAWRLAGSTKTLIHNGQHPRCGAEIMTFSPFDSTPYCRHSIQASALATAIVHILQRRNKARRVRRITTFCIFTRFLSRGQYRDDRCHTTMRPDKARLFETKAGCCSRHDMSQPYFLLNWAELSVPHSVGQSREELPSSASSFTFRQRAHCPADAPWWRVWHCAIYLRLERSAGSGSLHAPMRFALSMWYLPAVQYTSRAGGRDDGRGKAASMLGDCGGFAAKHESRLARLSEVSGRRSSAKTETWSFVKVELICWLRGTMASRACEPVTAAILECTADLIMASRFQEPDRGSLVCGCVGVACYPPQPPKRKSVGVVGGRVAPVNCLLGQQATVAASNTKHLSSPLVRQAGTLYRLSRVRVIHHELLWATVAGLTTAFAKVQRRPFSRVQHNSQ